MTFRRPPVKKALIPAAGFATRFLPASKAIPKNMFPVVDKPIIQVVVEELVKAGIEEVVLVLSPFSQAVQRYFEPFAELNRLLVAKGKAEMADQLKKIEKLAKFRYIEQICGRPGSGVAILSARATIGNEPFVMCWSDEFFLADPPWIKQLLAVYQQYGGSVLSCLPRSAPEDGLRFAFVTGEPLSSQVTKADFIVEKPGWGQAPSRLASFSGCVFQPEIFAYLDKANRALPEGQEMYHVDGLKGMLADGLPLYAYLLQNYRYFDTGDKLGYLKAQVELGLEHPETGKGLRKFLKNLV